MSSSWPSSSVFFRCVKSLKSGSGNGSEKTKMLEIMFCRLTIERWCWLCFHISPALDGEEVDDDDAFSCILIIHVFAFYEFMFLQVFPSPALRFILLKSERSFIAPISVEKSLVVVQTLQRKYSIIFLVKKVNSNR